MKIKLAHLTLCALLLMPSVLSEAYAAGGGTTAEAPVDKNAARITGSSTYFSVTGLHAPIASDRGSFDSMIAVDAGVDIKDDKLRASAMKQMPRVRDALRRAVHGYIAMSYHVGDVPDLDVLGARLQREADRLFGRGVAEVTISAVLVHTYT
ncbi:MAG: hypothetical protein CMK07_10195 [Ponticaulis sp.]|nr:hypothetical protein [Ponticaulis sp.]